MATITIDGKQYQVDAADNVLQAALGKGVNLPYFCWHPALGSVGACRQCAVIQYKDENDTVGRLVMSCMTPCADGARFSVDHPEAADMRRSVVEFLMTNHPHDCPVCEEGGHCHLQDMTVMTGHNYRRYRHSKRTHRNQDLGPFINHEMNRCIACYRCVRYYRDYAGGKDLDVFGSGAEVYFGRAESGTLESPFAGNLVEVCPTGVFTDKPYGESYTRKWDLQTSPSICPGCSIGCNISPGERYGQLKRVENRYHGEINGYFICDRGRFGQGFVNRDDRPRRPQLRHAHGHEAVTGAAAVAHVAHLVKQGGVVGIGSPRAALETNFALRALVGSKNFFSGQTTLDAELTALGLRILKGPARVATIRDAESADAVLVLGEDVSNTGARLALALRQATRQASFKAAAGAHIPAWQDASVRTLAQDLRSPLFNLTPFPSALDEIAHTARRAAPNEIARLGMAVAHALDDSAPVVEGLDAPSVALAASIAQALLAAERPLIVAGTNLGSAAVLQAASNIVAALARLGRQPMISLVFAEANSVGIGLFDADPLEKVVQWIADGKVETLIVAENDLYRRLPAPVLDAALAKLKHLVVLDCLTSPTTRQATVLLPAGAFTESDGTLVNNEARAQRFFQTFVPAGDTRESWRWLQQVAEAAGLVPLGETLDAITAACAEAIPALARIVEAAPNAKFRIAGAKVPRMPHRYSGRTAMDAKKDVHEPRPPPDVDSPLAFSMEGATGLGAEPAPLIPMFWYPSWNSPQAVNKFQDEIGGSLKGGDPGVHLLAGAAAAPTPNYFHPPAATIRGLQAVPLHVLFGSEELSGQAPVIQSRRVPVTLAVPASSKLPEGAVTELRFNGSAMSLPVRPLAAEGCVGIPAGLEGAPVVAPGAPVTLGGKA